MLLDDKGKVTNKNNLKNFPFLRFKTFYMLYNDGSISIDEKLHLLQDQLQLFGTALSDLKKITLSAKINSNDQSQFRSHFQLLDHIRDQLLPICDSSPFYSFSIDFQSDNAVAADFIATILQMRPITRCRDVLFIYEKAIFIQLPVKVISNWLNRDSDDGIGYTGQGKEMRLLATNYRIKVQNAVEMFDHMKMVITFYFIFTIKILKEVVHIL